MLFLLFQQQFFNILWIWFYILEGFIMQFLLNKKLEIACYTINDFT